MNLRFEASRKRREREETVLVVQSAIAFYFNRKFQSKNSRMAKTLTAQQRRLIASMLRVNQAGELGAGMAAECASFASRIGFYWHFLWRFIGNRKKFFGFFD